MAGEKLLLCSQNSDTSTINRGHFESHLMPFMSTDKPMRLFAQRFVQKYHVIFEHPTNMMKAHFSKFVRIFAVLFPCGACLLSTLCNRGICLDPSPRFIKKFEISNSPKDKPCRLQFRLAISLMSAPLATHSVPRIR